MVPFDEHLSSGEAGATERRPKILFLCWSNSCRSQMAEAWARHLWGDRFEVYSAGIVKKDLDPLAVEVMKEVGIDMAAQYSKTIEQLPHKDFDLVITVCDQAQEACPIFPAKTRLINHSFDDPPRLAEKLQKCQDRLALYRRVRDQIREFVEKLPALFQS